MRRRDVGPARSRAPITQTLGPARECHADWAQPAHRPLAEPTSVSYAAAKQRHLDQRGEYMDISLLLRGLGEGLSIAALLGPIGTPCIRRTLAEGRTDGFVSGLGAAAVDAIHGCVAGFGLALLPDLLAAPSDRIATPIRNGGKIERCVGGLLWVRGVGGCSV